ncbi:39S mitochondrial ribosomal protein L46-domain-containing protein [Sphaerosporella brunnea]|uniref:Large ribosomal subunit protein mL46 n=1 Tax=Sphaerosporella brunnea TaxID=1250544 RepID=A0A5J5EDS1_9PEZI|nr:39S mitochondrial ribosomal protein L46-domain-containing protein [Sphaerosporella brunnea]
MNAAGLRSARQPFGLLLKQHPRAARTYSSTAVATPPTAGDGFVPDEQSHGLPGGIPSGVGIRGETTSYRLASGVVLSRPPMLTRSLTPFEESYYFYQRRLNQRLALPFTRYFYFKKGTAADTERKRKLKALVEGGQLWTGFGKTGWKDELMVGDESHRSDDNGYRRLVESSVTGEDGDSASFEAPLPRRTKADEVNDRRSLDRAGERTLYLLVKSKREKHAWRFPQAVLQGRETLVESAKRTLAEAAGVNMNTWFVGNVPIGHLVYEYEKGFQGDADKIGKKVFFMKARIMAGQADLKDNKLGLEDFLWLTKEEIGEVVDKSYWESVKPMLVAH